MLPKRGRFSAKDAIPKCGLCGKELTKASKTVTIRVGGRQAKICEHHPAPESMKVEAKHGDSKGG